MKKYEQILKLLESEYGWKLFDSLTENGKKLVSDTLKAQKQVNKLPIHDVTTRNWFEKLPLHWKLAYHLIGGIIIGYLLHYVW